MGTKREAMFEELRVSTAIQVEGQEKALIANKEILKMCDRIIAEEQAKK